jgi:hypothetical protein
MREGSNPLYFEGRYENLKDRSIIQHFQMPPSAEGKADYARYHYFLPVIGGGILVAEQNVGFDDKADSSITRDVFKYFEF